MRRLLGALAFGALLLAGCSGGSPEPGSTAPAPSSAPGSTTSPPPSSSATSSATASATPSEVSEPTTTNTLPPPPEPSKPAASTAGKLTSRSLPNPKNWPGGWHTVARKGGAEEGFEGNGTWVHARDPRYAATDVITIGCRQVTRDDFSDPVSALEGNYENRSQQPGIGLALQFRTAGQAADYFQLYERQVQACRDPNVVAATIISSPLGLIDQRTYPDAQWTEVVKLDAERVTLILLSDSGHKISKTDAEGILSSIPG